ncbi:MULTISPECIES: hypothetical protein [Methylobacterium]|uniref:hypothetical protein n=1 Tax=Methylobacterium TaxID=407 RepID=UPI000B8183A7|nr:MULTISPECIES: hypothetical protein [Methylobacterium]MBK3399372.1 hypothetical protein [Methylobacterium ajmalii]MBK3409927.1 hypothetical protein [Methylobacterium ajmalii]MBK3425210.1 hypothetical protein [Methylobacterium ajmalii]MBZ6415970.1 hypothetical protein [Methylobacterium sp.]
MKAVAALRGPDGEPPFALLALRAGRDRSVQEETQDAAHAALDTLAGLIAAGQLGPDGAAIAQRLAHLTEMASRAAWRAQP